MKDITFMICTGIPTLFFAINSVKDIRKRSILLLPTLFMLVLGFIANFVDAGGLETVLLSLLPGFFILVTAFITRERIGYGDAWVMLMTGVWSGFERTLLCFLGALAVIAAAAPMLQKIHGKTGEKSELSIPLVPFLAAVYGLTLIFDGK